MSTKGIKKQCTPKGMWELPIRCHYWRIRVQKSGQGLEHGAEARARVQMLKGQENGEQI